MNCELVPIPVEVKFFEASVKTTLEAVSPETCTAEGVMEPKAIVRDGVCPPEEVPEEDAE